MGESVKKLIIFVTGAAIGSVVTWKVVQSKYKQLANDEIEEVREYYQQKIVELEGDQVESPDEPEDVKPKVAKVINYSSHYEQQVADLDYTTETPQDMSVFKKTKPKVSPTEDPYVITPEDFGEMDEYDTVSLTYYQGDGFLAHDNGELVDDIEEVIGWDALDSFGEYEDDAVHVRNDNLKCDFEILLDLRKYREVVRTK